MGDVNGEYMRWQTTDYGEAEGIHWWGDESTCCVTMYVTEGIK